MVRRERVVVYCGVGIEVVASSVGGGWGWCWEGG